MWIWTMKLTLWMISLTKTVSCSAEEESFILPGTHNPEQYDWSRNALLLRCSWPENEAEFFQCYQENVWHKVDHASPMMIMIMLVMIIMTMTIKMTITMTVTMVMTIMMMIKIILILQSILLSTNDCPGVWLVLTSSASEGLHVLGSWAFLWRALVNKMGTGNHNCSIKNINWRKLQ